MRPSLLIAESDAELCHVYRKFLAARGYDVATASDGLDCLQRLRLQRPTVLLLDLELRWGGADGVLAWLREEGASDRIAVVLMATAGYPKDLTALVEPPVVGFLPKPFSLTALLDRVRSAANGGRKDGIDRIPVHSELFFG
jgi:two-component system KDP operon response regulator KdpE